jgi:hypothetical protein
MTMRTHPAVFSAGRLSEASPSRITRCGYTEGGVET